MHPDLAIIVELEPRADRVFRGRVPQVGWQRVFGGLVIAQALRAAQLTVTAKHSHSLHGYFLLGGDPARPIDYEVEAIRDGRSFATRRVLARQDDDVIFSMSASFHTDEPDGFVHQAPMPNVPAPEDLPTLDAIRSTILPTLPHPVRAYFERERPIDLRPVDFARYRDVDTAQIGNRLWLRANTTLPDDPELHACILAYASDMTLLDSALVRHHTSVFDPGIMPASLDHIMWFHRTVRADDWLFYEHDSPNAGGGRGFARGMLFARDGTLVASVAQEGIIRKRRGYA